MTHLRSVPGFLGLSQRRSQSLQALSFEPLPLTSGKGSNLLGKGYAGKFVPQLNVSTAELSATEA